MALRRKGRAAGTEVFPGFANISEIGSGSLATVYRAREIDTNRQVALKLLNVRDASPRALESFQRESIALGALSAHPNIVTLFRTFPTPDGRPVLVLELCVAAVSDRLRTAPLPVQEAVSIAIKVAGALETAHRGQILHRDVKPQNILITEFGEPALADFGVAMLQSSTQTTAGLFDFTTLHAAPELLEGGATSAATDVYELASTLYQLIVGQSAFRSYDGESPASVILRILRDPVQPVVAAGVPVALSDLLVWSMSKDKDHRPPTAAEFAVELSEIEVAQGWPRTQFLIRDAAGGVAGAPARITRLPVRPVSVQAHAAQVPPVPVSETDWSEPTWSEAPWSQPTLSRVPVATALSADSPASPTRHEPARDEAARHESARHESARHEPARDEALGPVAPGPGPAAPEPRTAVPLTAALPPGAGLPSPPRSAGSPAPHPSGPALATPLSQSPGTPTARAVRNELPAHGLPEPQAPGPQASVPEASAPAVPAAPVTATHAAPAPAIRAPATPVPAAVLLAASAQGLAEPRRGRAGPAHAAPVPSTAEPAPPDPAPPELAPPERTPAGTAPAPAGAPSEPAPPEPAPLEPAPPEPAPAEPTPAGTAPAPAGAPESAWAPPPPSGGSAPRPAPLSPPRSATTSPAAPVPYPLRSPRPPLPVSSLPGRSAWTAPPPRPPMPAAPLPRTPPTPPVAAELPHAPPVAAEIPAAPPPPQVGTAPPVAAEMPAAPPDAAEASNVPLWLEPQWADSETPPRETEPTPPPVAPTPAQPSDVSYPIPPAALFPARDQDGAFGDPAAALRMPRPPQRVRQFGGDIVIDPMSLRRRLRLHAGMSALTVDDRRLTTRIRAKRSRIPWTDVLGFEARVEAVDAEGVSSGSLIALTTLGAVELPATRGSLAEVRYAHAMLDAYRVRARLTQGHGG